MNYKTIKFALSWLIKEDGWSVLADLDKYIEDITKKLDYLEGSLTAQRNLKESLEEKVIEFEKRDQERLSVIERLEDQLENIVNPSVSKN